jgi:hypothetical protein
MGIKRTLIDIGKNKFYFSNILIFVHMHLKFSKHEPNFCSHNSMQVFKNSEFSAGENKNSEHKV